MKHNNLDVAFEALRKWIASYPNDAELFSETDTRSKIIDTFVTSVLGWNEANIRREIRYTDDENKKSIDYTLSTGRPRLVIEAKKHAVDFDIPPSTKHEWFSLNGVIRTWESAWAAIQQARAYADQIGAPYVLVTNGYQFILFRSINDKGPWNSGKAFVISDLKKLSSDCFTKLYKFISFHNIEYDYFLQDTLQMEAARFRLRPRDVLPGNNSGYRNGYTVEMTHYFAPILLTNTSPTRDFIQECYCSSDETLQSNDLLSKALLSDPAPTFKTPVAMVRPGHKKDSFSTSVGGFQPNLPNNPLYVLMGGTGVGKTTFLHWFFLVSVPENKIDNIIPVIVDFRKKTVSRDRVAEDGMKYITQQLTEEAAQYCATFSQVKEIFSKQVKSLTAGLLAPYTHNKEEFEKELSTELRKLMDNGVDHFNCIVDYLIEKPKKKVVVVLDNVDQLPDDIQVALYQLAQTVANASKCLTIIVLRESSYYRMLKTRQVDAFTNADFHIRARPLAEVLSKRFEYMSKQIGPSSKRSRVSDSTVQITDIGAFVKLLKRSLLDASADPEILKCLQSVSNGNLRKQLDMLFKFLTSGQTKMEDYALMSVAAVSKTVPFHEFLHSAIHQDHRVYDEGHSEYILNVFEPGPEPQSSHFTALRILHYFRTMGQIGELREQDYVSVDDICNQFSVLGLTPDAVMWYVRRLKRFGLIADRSQDDVENHNDEDVAMTRSGWYYLNSLHSNATYIMAMCPDTAIFDKQVYENIVNTLQKDFTTAKVPINARLRMGEVFAKYLAKQEAIEHQSNALRNHQHFGKFLCGETCIQSIERVGKVLYRQN